MQLGAAPPTSNADREARAAWAAAYTRYRHAQAALESFRVEIGAPALATLSDALDREWERLGEEVGEAYAALMDTPAPDRNSFRWKLEQLLEVEDNGYTPMWRHEIVAQTKADIARMLAGA